ncbi:MAG: hypothetical protein IJ523_03040 [Succinivibrionaceae bacterium]|nr:hypothetical protein [Succinivibrionaceae bacterium]
MHLFELKHVVCETLQEALRVNDGVRYETVQKRGFYERSVITVVDKTDRLALRIQRIARRQEHSSWRRQGIMAMQQTPTPLPNFPCLPKNCGFLPIRRQGGSGHDGLPAGLQADYELQKSERGNMSMREHG